MMRSTAWQLDTGPECATRNQVKQGRIEWEVTLFALLDGGQEKRADRGKKQTKMELAFHDSRNGLPSGTLEHHSTQ